MNRCPKCDALVHLIHTDKMCNYWFFKKEMKELDHSDVTYSKYLNEFAANGIEVKKHRWFIDSNNPAQGYVDCVYVERWASDAVDLYDQNYSSGFTLEEFMTKFAPVK